MRNEVAREELSVAGDALSTQICTWTSGGTSVKAYDLPCTDLRHTASDPTFRADLLEPLIENRPPDAFFFGSGTAPLLRPHAEYSWFVGAVKQAMAVDTNFPRVTPHDLRHTAASLAVSAGANMKLVQSMLGHKSAAGTLDHYGDLFEQDIDKVAAELSAARALAA